MVEGENHKNTRTQKRGFGRGTWPEIACAITRFWFMYMLAIATTHQLTLVDPQGLRRPPPSLPPCLSLLVPCTSSAWSPDNLSLFLSSARTIHQYNPAL